MCFNVSALAPAIPYITLVGGAILGAFGSYFVGTRLADRKELRDACFAFKESFAVEFTALKHPDCLNPIDPYDLLKVAFPQHRAAFIKFYCRLPSSKQEDFARAWYNYYAYDDTKKVNAEYLLKYSPGWEQQSIQKCRGLAITNLEKLLKFADHK